MLASNMAQKSEKWTSGWRPEANSNKNQKNTQRDLKSMPLDTPKSYFEYENRNIFKAYAVLKTRPQGRPFSSQLASILAS